MSDNNEIIVTVMLNYVMADLDNIDTNAASELGIVVTYAPRENSVSVAELTLGDQDVALRPR